MFAIIIKTVFSQLNNFYKFISKILDFKKLFAYNFAPTNMVIKFVKHRGIEQFGSSSGS